MSTFSVCCVFMVLLTVVNSTNNATEYQKHSMRVYQFRCKEPQRRAISVSSMLNLGSDQVYHPAVTVLHRCDAASGCCPQNERLVCGPVTVEQVSLVFTVKKIETEVMPKLRRRDTREKYVSIVVTNHTLCGCQDIADLPK